MSLVVLARKTRELQRQKQTPHTFKRSVSSRTALQNKILKQANTAPGPPILKTTHSDLISKKVRELSSCPSANVRKQPSFGPGAITNQHIMNKLNGCASR
jgi:hypothetical protein